MNPVRQSLVEGVRALVVIALIFLCFGHKPVYASVSYDGQLIAKVLDAGLSEPGCGDPADHGDHTPCHACRVFTGLDLPPSPVLAVPAFGKVLDIAYALMPEPLAFAAPAPIVRPRGPPTV